MECPLIEIENNAKKEKEYGRNLKMLKKIEQYIHNYGKSYGSK